jgi:hypothetical protein
MITDARAQVDLIAALHLESLFKKEHLEDAGDQSNRVTHAATAMPHSTEHDSLRLRHRLAVIQSLAVRARGLTIKIDMAQEAPTQRIDSVSSQFPANEAAQGGYRPEECVVATVNEGGHSSA